MQVKSLFLDFFGLTAATIFREPPKTGRHGALFGFRPA
jgi:hypothetical protein